MKHLEQCLSHGGHSMEAGELRKGCFTDKAVEAYFMNTQGHRQQRRS